MIDGHRFTNAAYIEPGWVLVLPAGSSHRGDGRQPSRRDRRRARCRTGRDVVVDRRRGDGCTDSMARDLGAQPGRGHGRWLGARRARPDHAGMAARPSDLGCDRRCRTATVATARRTHRSPPHPWRFLGAPQHPPWSPSTGSHLPHPPPTFAVPTAPDAPATTTEPPPPAVIGSPPAVGDLGKMTAMIDGRRMFGLEHAAMLSVGVLTLVGVHRLRRLRTAGPRARVPPPTPRSLTTERALRTIGADERLLRVDIAIRAAASQLSDRDRRILAVMVDDQGAVEIVLSAPCPTDEPFSSTGDRWHLAATTTTESLSPAARPVGAPCVGLVQLGVTPDSRDLYVDLEALTVLAVDAAADRADAVVTAIAATLGTSVLAEVAQLVGVGLDPATFVGHRHHVGCDSFDAAFDLATSLLGSTALATRVDVRAAFADGRRRGVGTGDRARGVRLRRRSRRRAPRAWGAGASGGRRRTPRRGAPHAGRAGVDLAARTDGYRRHPLRPRWRRADRHHRARRARLGRARRARRSRRRSGVPPRHLGAPVPDVVVARPPPRTGRRRRRAGPRGGVRAIEDA